MLLDVRDLMAVCYSALGSAEQSMDPSTLVTFHVIIPAPPAGPFVGPLSTSS